MSWKRRHTRFLMAAPLLAALVLAGACSDSEEEEDLADSIATMRLNLSGGTVTVTEAGASSGGPIVIAPGETAITATFHDASGAAISGLDAEFELRITPANPGIVTFTRSSAFAGSLRYVARGSTTLAVELFHLGEQHADFGPFTIALTAQ